MSARRASTTQKTGRVRKTSQAKAKARRAAPRKKAKARAKTSGRGKNGGLFDAYRPLPGTYDETFDEKGKPRRQVASFVRLFDRMGQTEFRTRQKLADGAFLRGGVTFSVYSDARGVEKIFPFDLIPRTISARDWDVVEKGLQQRIRALDLFLADVYGEQRILDEERVPRELIEKSKGFRPEVRGVKPPGGVHVVVAGIDLIRRPDGVFVVLEDNLRTPSGVSYVLENRAVMKRVYPHIFAEAHVRPVDQYAAKLRRALVSLSPIDPARARTVVLTPGPFNSAYFEHVFLAREMGVELVQGQDLFVHDDRVYVKTTRGPTPVDVIYSRIDDDFIDPEVFRPESMLGVKGLFRAYQAGNVVLANGIGNGIADDKAVYPFVPDMIRFYLDEEPILPQVETLVCARPEDRARVLADLSGFVVKAVDASGGYGMLMGHQASKKELAEFARKIKNNPRGYIAQPLVEFSTCPTWDGERVAPRRVDLRPYIITGRDGSWVLPSGLTRVALVEGSYVVNSSQGGGSKDTWVLES